MQKVRFFQKIPECPKSTYHVTTLFLYFKSVADWYFTCYLTVNKSIVSDINLFGLASELKRLFQAELHFPVGAELWVYLSSSESTRAAFWKRCSI